MSITSFARQRFALAVLSAGLAAPSVASAQLRTELTPFVASYYGLTHLASGDVGLIAGNPFTFDQKNAFAFGGRISVPIGARVAIEGEFSYATSGASVTEKDVFGPGLDGGISQDGHVMFGSVRAVISPRRSNLYLIIGPGIVKRGGDAWKGVKSSKLTDFGAVAGFGIRANVTPRFRINFTAESYIYSFNGLSGQGSKTQADVLVGVGVPISLGGH